MFGRAKFQAGVLIFPAPQHVFANEELEKKAYIELIWYVVFVDDSLFLAPYSLLKLGQPY